MASEKKSQSVTTFVPVVDQSSTEQHSTSTQSGRQSSTQTGHQTSSQTSSNYGTNLQTSHKDVSFAKDFIDPNNQDKNRNKALTDAGVLNPDGTEKTPYDYLGVDDKREQELAANRVKEDNRKRIAAAIYDSAAVLGDIAIGAMGGNVVARDPAYREASGRAEKDRDALDTMRKAQQAAAQKRLDDAKDKALQRYQNQYDSMLNIVANSGDQTSTGETFSYGQTNGQTDSTSKTNTTSSSTTKTDATADTTQLVNKAAKNSYSFGSSDGNGGTKAKVSSDGYVHVGMRVVNVDKKGNRTDTKKYSDHAVSPDAYNTYTLQLQNNVTNYLKQKGILNADGTVKLSGSNPTKDPVIKWMADTGVIQVKYQTGSNGNGQQNGMIDLATGGKATSAKMDFGSAGVQQNPYPISLRGVMSQSYNDMIGGAVRQGTSGIQTNGNLTTGGKQSIPDF